MCDLQVGQLGLNGNFKLWNIKVMNYFKYRNVWAFVELNHHPQPVTTRSESLTSEQVKARTMAELFSFVHNDVAGLIAGAETAHEAYVLIKKIFIGDEVSQRSKLTSELYKWVFKGNFFIYLNGFYGKYMNLKNIGGINSYRDVALLLIDNLPKDKYAMLVYTIKENLNQHEEDTEDIFVEVYDTLTNFAIEAGLYSPPSRENHSARNTDKKGNNCFHCGEHGHYKRECPKLKTEPQVKKENINNETNGSFFVYGVSGPRCSFGH